MAIADSLLELAKSRRHVMGLSVLRMIAGGTIVYEYVRAYAQRGYVFGPGGVSPHEYATYTLYSLSDHPLYFELIYHLGAAVALAWALGIYTRLLTPLNLVFWWSLQRVNPGIWDGGDNLMQLVLIYCCFADVGHHSIMGVKRVAGAASLPGRLFNLTHNAAVLAIALQVSVLYTVAGTMKIAGESWRNGTALYYAMRPEEFYLPGVSDLLWSSRELLTIMGYGTIYVQAAFPLLLFLNKYSRRVAIVLVIGLHLGIMFVMGLVTFALFMIAVDLSLLTDAEYEWLASRARQLSPFKPWSTSRNSRPKETPI